MILAKRLLAAVLTVSALSLVGCANGGANANHATSHAVTPRKKQSGLESLFGPAATAAKNPNKKNATAAAAATAATVAPTPAKPTRAQKKAERDFNNTIANMTNLARQITGTTGKSPTQKSNELYKRLGG